MMLRILLPLALAALTQACGGRAALHEESGRAFEQVWQAQVEATPKDKLAAFTAAEATTVMGNHTARYSKGGVAKPGGGGGGGVGGGLLTPATTDLGSLGLGGGEGGGAGGPGDRKISLEP
jgi:hypothetical protein